MFGIPTGLSAQPDWIVPVCRASVGLRMQCYVCAAALWMWIRCQLALCNGLRRVACTMVLLCGLTGACIGFWFVCTFRANVHGVAAHGYHRTGHGCVVAAGLLRLPVSCGMQLVFDACVCLGVCLCLQSALLRMCRVTAGSLAKQQYNQFVWIYLVSS